MFVLFKILPAGGRNQPNHKGSSKSQISPTRKTLRGNHRNSDMSATQNATVANPVSVFIHQAWDRTSLVNRLRAEARQGLTDSSTGGSYLGLPWKSLCTNQASVLLEINDCLR